MVFKSKKLFLFLFASLFASNISNLLAGGNDSVPVAKPELNHKGLGKAGSLEELLLMQNLNRYDMAYDPNIDLDTDFSKVLKYSLKSGIKNGISSTTRDVVSNSLKFIPGGISKFGNFLGAMLYKLSFGSRGLSVSDLAKINNRIYNLCLPFANVSAGSMDKKRRASLIDQDQSGITLNDENWKAVQTELINELEHAVYYLEKSIPCYDLNKLKCSMLSPKLFLAKVVHALSNEDHEEINYYIIRAVTYLNKLIEQINSFTSFEDTQNKCEDTKRWLSWTLNSFEQIALFLDDNASLKSSNRVPFQRLNMQGGSSVPSLDSLLGSLQNN